MIPFIDLKNGIFTNGYTAELSEGSFVIKSTDTEKQVAVVSKTSDLGKVFKLKKNRFIDRVTNLYVKDDYYINLRSMLGEDNFKRYRDVFRVNPIDYRGVEKGDDYFQVTIESWGLYITDYYDFNGNLISGEYVGFNETFSKK